MKAGAIALGDELANSLSSDLVVAGFSAQEAEVISSSSRDEMTVAAGSIAVETSLLLRAMSKALSLIGIDDLTSLTALSEPLVNGAVGALNSPSIALSDERKVLAMNIIMKSAVKSVGVKSKSDSEKTIELQEKMVSAAISKLSSANISEDVVSEAVGAVVSGSVSGLETVVDSDDVSKSIESITSKTVSSLASSGLPQEKLSSMVYETSKGAVSGMSFLGTEKTAELAGVSSAAIVKSIPTLGIDIAKQSEISGEAARGGVKGLKNAGLDDDKIVEATQKIVSSAASAASSVMGDDSMGDVAGKIASSVVVEMSSLVDSSKLVSSNAVSKVMTGVTKGISQNKPASTVVSNVIKDMSSNIVSSMARMNVGSEIKGSLVKNVMTGGSESVAAIESLRGDDSVSTLMGSIVTNIIRELPNSNIY